MKKQLKVVLKSEVCQACKSHTNRPSFCTLKDKYVGRKTEACAEFKIAKGYGVLKDG
jgi:hypothetical protein